MRNKSQITKSKFQTNSKFQISKLQTFCFGRCDFGNWLLFVIWCLVFWLFPQNGFCDWLRLETKDEGYEVDILEEGQDSFIVKIPKSGIETIIKRKPTQVETWKEKKILWEDTGDYITLYLPKGKIVLPENYTGEEYDSAKALGRELKYTGSKGAPQDTVFWKGTGKLIGRILKQGQPASGIKVKIVNVSSQKDTLSRVFGPKDDKPENLAFEADTDETGQYVFTNIPLGDYDVYWLAPGRGWYRRLSEKPDLTIRPGETTEHSDIEIK